jgi:hypothetical protein
MKSRIEICTMSRTPQGAIPWTKTDKYFEVDLDKLSLSMPFKDVPHLSVNGVANMLMLFVPTPDGGRPPVSNASYTDVEEVIYNLYSIADYLDGKWHMTQVTFIANDQRDVRVLKLYKLYADATIRLEIGLGKAEHTVVMADVFTSKHMALMVQHHTLMNRRKNDKALEDRRSNS